MLPRPAPLRSTAIDALATAGAALSGGALAWAALGFASAGPVTRALSSAAFAVAMAALARRGVRAARANRLGRSLAGGLAATAGVGVLAGALEGARGEGAFAIARGVARGAMTALTFGLVPWLLASLAVLALVRAVRDARASQAHDAWERAASVTGLVVLSSGALTVASGGFVPWVVASGGLALLTAAVVRDALRARWLGRVHAGLEPGWGVEEPDGAHALPAVATGVPTAAVLTFDPSQGPYRAGRPSAVAATARDGRTVVRWLERRAQLALAGGAFGVLLAMASWSVGAARAARASAAHVAPVAPRCADARPYFRERLGEVPNIGRATLLTHHEDPSLQEGEGVLLLVPRAGGASTEAQRAAALDIARSIPCRDKLSLRVEDPVLRPIDVEAKLTLEEGADPARVREQATLAIADLFEPTDSAVVLRHVDFGAEEHAVGWQVGYVLRTLPGVRRASVALAGHRGDVQIGPREFPVLGKLTFVGPSGAPL